VLVASKVEMMKIINVTPVNQVYISSATKPLKTEEFQALVILVAKITVSSLQSMKTEKNVAHVLTTVKYALMRQNVINVIHHFSKLKMNMITKQFASLNVAIA
jgi:hypothetical protein